MQNSLMDKSQAAIVLGISQVTLDRLRRDGRLSFRQIGGQIRFLQSDIDDYVANSLSTGIQRRGAVEDQHENP